MTAFLFALLLAIAFAHDRPFEACKQDRETFCPEVHHKELHQCMHAHWSQLSEKCQTTIKEMVQAHHERVRVACGNDVESLCPEFKENPEQLRSCMSSAWESLSQQCKDALIPHHPRHDGHQGTDGAHKPHHEQPENMEHDPSKCPMKSCMTDVHTLCPEANTKEAAHECLKNNWDALSVACRAAIEEMKAHNNGITGNEFQTEEASVGSSSGAEGMSFREEQAGGVMVEGGDVFPVETVNPPQLNWKYWLVRLWWVYPVSLVLIIQTIACVRIRQIRKQESL